MHAQTKSEIEYFLKDLGVRWFGIHEARLSEIPAGSEAMVWMNLGVAEANWALDRAGRIAELTDYEIESYQFHTVARIQEMVGQNPGLAWMIMGEVNRRSTAIGGAAFAAVYHYYYTQIKAADDTAIVLGPAVLNWDFTCLGCLGEIGSTSIGGGYTGGVTWITAFIDAYQQAYGTKPPVDVWPIQIYPLDWTNLPNGDTDPANYPNDYTVGLLRPHWRLAAGQVEHFRTYLDANGYGDKAIWITETGIHSGFDGATRVGNLVFPVGSYHSEFVGDYLSNWLGWLEQNHESHNIDRWFFFTSYTQLGQPNGDGYQGITFFNTPDSDTAQRTCMGDIYHAASLGQPTLTCDAGGDAVPFTPP